MKWKPWLYGLASAAIAGGVTVLGSSLVAPEVALTSALKIAGVAALIGAANYLKQSPLPPRG